MGVFPFQKEVVEKGLRWIIWSEVSAMLRLLKTRKREALGRVAYLVLSERHMALG